MLSGGEAVGASEIGFDGTGIPVAVLDKGIDPDHPDSQRPVPLSAAAVVARMRATADQTVFVDGVDIADCGEGLVKAPSLAVS